MIRQILDEGIVKPEDHQDVATQMWDCCTQNIQAMFGKHANCSYTFYATGMDDMTKVRKAIFMFTDLFGMERFDYRTVVTFFVGEHKEPPDLKSCKCESFVSLVHHLITKRLNLGKAH